MLSLANIIADSLRYIYRASTKIRKAIVVREIVDIRDKYSKR